MTARWRSVVCRDSSERRADSCASRPAAPGTAVVHARLIRSALVLLLLAVPTLADEMRVEALPVRSRPAEDLAEALRPIVGTEGEIVVAGGRLVVRASPAALAEIKRARNVGDVILSASSPPSGILSVDQRLGEVGSLLVKLEDAR